MQLTKLTFALVIRVSLRKETWQLSHDIDVQILNQTSHYLTTYRQLPIPYQTCEWISTYVLNSLSIVLETTSKPDVWNTSYKVATKSMPSAFA